MEITVQSTTRERKQSQGKNYWGVKHTDGNWYNLITDDKPSQGQTFNVDVKTSDWQGKTYRWATINQKAQAAAAGSGNGHTLTWDEYAEMARKAHDLARQLENDVSCDPNTNDQYIDRSQARVRFVNNVLMAFKDGKISLPEEDGPPPPSDDDIPF